MENLENLHMFTTPLVFCSFATDIVDIYYNSDEVVCEDIELQAFVKDIYIYGMRGIKASGETYEPFLETDSLFCLVHRNTYNSIFSSVI